MKQQFYLFVMLLSCITITAQEDYSLCSGHIGISPNISYELKFKGNINKDKSGVQSYCTLPVKANNFIWVQFKPPHNGDMKMDLMLERDSIILFVFEVDPNEGCSSIASKKAKLVSCEQRSIDDTLFPKYSCNVAKSYFFGLYIDKGKTSSVKLKLNYTPLTEDGKVFRDSLLLNLAYKKELPVYGVHFRDEITGYPVISRLSFYASSILDGTYRGSDILVNNQKKLKATLRIDAEGYYSKDIFDFEIPFYTHHDTIKLSPIAHGTVTKLDDIYFMGGMAVILEESMPRLKRLKDFLLLNPTISIEVQGHVNDEGGNSLSSQRLSKKRAKRIVEYLIACGIEPERLTSVGYGNTKPIFSNPETEEQKEANRRVEVKIR